MWCSRMVVAPKKDGTPQRTVDLQRLNAATHREMHHTPSPFNLVSSIPTGKLKTVLDAWNGYHSLPLTSAGKEATTFITEWGRYRYRRAPMGFHASGDAYTRRFDDITAGQKRVVRCVDDSLLWDSDIESAFWHTCKYIKLCADSGIIFNRDKFTFAEATAEFAGFEITMDSYRPPKRIIAAIRDFPTPKNITDIRAWFGLVNQVAYSFAQAQVMAPFRELLASKTRLFYWDETMDALFQRSKDEICHLVQEGIRSFEINRPTCLSTDWSKTGIGFTLMQKHCGCPSPTRPDCGLGHWKLVFAGSRFTRGAESRYAPIEGEALAVVYALHSCRMFIMGCPNLLVAVDHKPLIKIFNDRALESINNPRILQMKEKTLMYNFRIVHIPGKFNEAPDAASRYPTRSDGEDGGIDQESSEAASIEFAAHQAEGVRSLTWSDVVQAAIPDEECASLVRQIEIGFPEERDAVPNEIRQFWAMRDDLYVVQNVPFRGRRMLVPKSLRPQVLEGLHAAHQGVNGMLANARERLFWPGLDAAVRLTRAQCRQCNEHSPSQAREPAIETVEPDIPFQQVVMDLFDLAGHQFLVYADRYSGWVEVVKLRTATFKNMQQILLRWFSTFGVPEELSTDGGPPFNSNEYTVFLRTWGIRKRMSSAYFPQSNGRAEAVVKSAKRILLGNINPATGQIETDEATRALLLHRNTPAQDTGISPAVSLYGCPLKDHLPHYDRAFRKEWQMIADAREVALGKRHMRPHMLEGRELECLQIGDAVQIQNQHGNRPNQWHSTGVIVEALPFRQYRVVVDGSRRTMLRNRRYLRKKSTRSAERYRM